MSVDGPPDLESWVQAWGLPSRPTLPQVTRAWRRQVQRHHPDRHGGSATAHAQFLLLQEQHEQIKKWVDAGWPASTTDEPPVADATLAPDVPVSPLPAVHAPRWVVPASDLSLQVRAPLAFLWQGGVCWIRVHRAQPCECVTLTSVAPCPRCRGVHQRFETHLLRVVFPPLATPRQRVRLCGQGHQGTHAQGDLWLTLQATHLRRWRWDPHAQVWHRKVWVPLGWEGAVWFRDPAGDTLSLVPPLDGTPSRLSRPGTTMAAEVWWVGVSGIAALLARGVQAWRAGWARLRATHRSRAT